MTSPIESVPGVGPKRGEAFRRLGIPSVAHLIDHLPHRHEFEQGEDQIANLVVGQVGEVECRISNTSGDLIPGTNVNAFRTIQRQDVGVQLVVRPQINAGGGITLLSEPGPEYEETLTKAARVFQAFEPEAGRAP